MIARSEHGVLVPADLTAAGVNAAWRAALVARDLGAPLRLLLVGPQERAEAKSALRLLAASIGSQLDVHVDVEVDPADALAATVRAARDAALVVIGPRRGNALRELVLGTPAERLIRLCRVPVLVVKQPASGSYRRVLVPVELVPAARPVIAAASRLSHDPRVEVLHALRWDSGISVRVSDVPQAVVRRYRQRAAERARSELRHLVAQSSPHARAARCYVGFGDAASVVLARERALAAELLVIGKRTRGLLADFFLGSVTQRVLASARSDVLVLPQPPREPGGAAALRWEVRPG